MVQLKSEEMKIFVRQLQCFNSCMVQLKYFAIDNNVATKIVLIPVWCN